MNSIRPRFLETRPLHQQEQERIYDQIFQPYRKVGTPLGCPERLEIYLKRTGRFVPEFYTAPAYGAFTQDQIVEKTKEIHSMDTIFVPTGILSRAKEPDLKIHFGRQQEPFIQKLFVFPIRYRWRNEPLFPDIEWAKAINRDFTVIRTFQGYALMKRKGRSVVFGK